MEFKKASPVIFDECVKVIRNSFITVANHFNLTKENAPINPAFIEIDALNKMYEKNIDMFIVLENDVYIGFVAIEKANNEIYYMEKLAILPEYRHKGYGKKISIGIINENDILKKWYLSYGFIETETKVFKHLPFTVCFMEKKI